MAKNVEIKISADAKDAEKGLNRVASAAKRAGNSMDNFSDKMGRVNGACSGAIAGTNKMAGALNAISTVMSASVLRQVADAIVSIGTATIGAAAQMRQYEIAFQTMLKSAEDGHIMLQQLQKFAAETPFDVPGVVEAAQQLMAFGFTAEEIIPTLRNLGDTAAGLGKGTAGVQQIAYAMGQIRTSGTLKTQDINQLTTAGISAWEILAEAAGKSVMEIKKMTERGMIDSLKAVEVLTAGMEERYGGMMAKTAEEVTGLWSNIIEGIGTAQATLGAFMTEAGNVKGILKEVSEAVTGVSDSLMESYNAGKSFGEAIREAVPEPVLVAVGALAALFAGAVVAGFAAATMAAWGFITATLPISGTVLAVSAAVGAAVTAIAIYWDEIRAATEVAWNSIAGLITGTINSVLAVVFKGLEQLSYGISKAAGFLGKDTTEIDKFHDAVDGALQEALNGASDGFANLTLGANTYADALERIKAEQRGLTGTSDDWDSVSAEFNPYALLNEKEKVEGPTKPIVDLTPLGMDANNTAMKASEKRVASLKENLERARKETDKFKHALDDLQADISYADMYGDEKAQEGIRRETKQRLQSLQEVLDKQREAVTEAEKYRLVAMEEGNAEAIKRAEELLKTRADLLRESLAQEEDIKASIEVQGAEKLANYLSSVEQAVVGMGKSIAGEFSDAVTSILTGSQSASAALAQFARNVITNALKMAAEFAGLCATLALFGVIPPGPIAAKMMFGIDPKHPYAEGSRGAKLAAGHATGGYISGPDTSTSDSIPSMLSNGEYVVNAAAVRKIGVPTLDAINAGHGIVPAGTAGAGTTRAQSINLSISTVDASSFGDFLNRGGLDRIKQALLDDGRGFRTEAGTW